MIPSRSELAPQSSPPQSSSKYTPELPGTPEDILAELGFQMPGEVDPDVAADEAAADEALAAQAEVPAPAAEEAAKPPIEAPAPAPAEVVPDKAAKALMDREAALIEREAAIKQYDADVRGLAARLDAFEEAQRQFQIDPIAYIRALAPELDLDDVAKQLWYEKLGTAAPAEYRLTKEVRAAKKEVHQTRAEFEAERKRIAEENARKEADAAEARRVEELRGYVTAVPSDYALVQHLAKQKPDVAVRMLRDAERMIAPGLGRSPTREETAKAVNEYLNEIGYVVPTPAPVTEVPAQKQASAPVTQPPTSIRNSHSAVQPGRLPPDESDPRVLRKRGYEALAAAVGDPTLANLPVD